MRPRDHRYGVWIGFPKGHAEDTTRCVEEVMEQGRGAMRSQCSRKRGHGPDGLWCKQHNPEAVKDKQMTWEARYNAMNLEGEEIKAEAKRIGKMLGVPAGALYLWNARSMAVKYGRQVVISFEDALKLIAEMDRLRAHLEDGYA